MVIEWVEISLEDDISSIAFRRSGKCWWFLRGTDQCSVVLRLAVPVHRIINECSAWKTSQWYAKLYTSRLSMVLASPLVRCGLVPLTKYASFSEPVSSQRWALSAIHEGVRPMLSDCYPSISKGECEHINWSYGYKEDFMDWGIMIFRLRPAPYHNRLSL